MSENQPCATPVEDLCASALKHYDEVSSAAHHWHSVIPQAIRYWYLERPKLERENAELKKERDEARANYKFMVERAADTHLEGYRELASKCATLEQERDELRDRLDTAEKIIAAARASVANPAWAGVADEDIMLERALTEYANAEPTGQPRTGGTHEIER